MLNYIWLGLVLLAVIIGGCTDHLREVADKSFEMAKLAVMDIALPLVGIMAVWLGVMRLAERSGLVGLLAKALSPIMRWLFPDVPADHPAMGSILLNMAANMLGLGNAATPLGLRAMQDLETLNPRLGVATNAMCTFLAINTSSVQLIPVTAIAILAAANSKNPSAIVGTSIIATTCAALSAVVAAKLLQNLGAFRLPKATPSQAIAAAPADPAVMALPRPPMAAKPVGDSPLKEAAGLQPISPWGHAALTLFGLCFVYFFLRLVFPSAFASLHFTSLFSAPAMGDSVQKSLFIRCVDAISILSIPFLLSAFPLYAALRRVKVYEEFVEGAKEGFDVALKIIPYLVTMLVAIGMFRAAGGIDLLSSALGPVMKALGFPSDLLPMVFMRPLSGSGTLGIFAELVKQFGPDSLIARTGGTIYGSTETTFYVLAVYFGAVGIKQTRHALPAGLIADAVGVIASVIICRLMFA